MAGVAGGGSAWWWPGEPREGGGAHCCHCGAGVFARLLGRLTVRHRPPPPPPTPLLAERGRGEGAMVALCMGEQV